MNWALQGSLELRRERMGEAANEAGVGSARLDLTARIRLEVSSSRTEKQYCVWPGKQQYHHLRGAWAEFPKQQ